MIVLHVFSDDKFFDNVSDFFDTIPCLENRYVYYTPNKEYKFLFIKNIHKLKVVNNINAYKKEFACPEVKIIYFHSLHPSWYKYFKFIPKTKIIIWWAWGYDIYNNFELCTPLVPLNLYKPLTSKYMTSQRKSLYYYIRNLYWLIRYLYDFNLRKKVISRVNCFSPVIPIEYDLIKKNCNYFKAEPFMINIGPGITEIPDFSYHQYVGNILLGNSLTFSNNHLDIFLELEKMQLSPSSKYIIPINYGTDFSDKIKFKRMSNLGDKAVWLENFIPYKEYTCMIQSCSHAIFGVIRQQAMGNLNLCLARGVKIFLYKNSVIYQYFLKVGYKVFTIEDMTSEQLNTPLSKQDAYNNYKLFLNIRQHRIEYAAEEFNRIIS